MPLAWFATSLSTQSPVTDAEALLDLAPHRLDKVRYALDCPGGDWVVDCFQAENAPLGAGGGGAGIGPGGSA